MNQSKHSPQLVLQIEGPKGPEILVCTQGLIAFCRLVMLIVDLPWYWDFQLIAYFLQFFVIFPFVFSFLGSETLWSVRFFKLILTPYCNFELPLANCDID